MQAAPVAAAASSPAGPTTQILDDFNRANETPLSQGGAWAPYDPRGGCCSATLRVLSQQASASDGQNRISFRTQDYPGDFELYATIAAKPGNGNAVGLVLDIVEIGPYSWDGYYLTWDDQSGIDTLRFEKVTDNQFGGNIAVTNLEMTAGDKFLARRIGDQLEGWVYQSGSWSLQLQATDASYHGGKLGALIRNTTGRLDDFGGGGYVPPPPAVTSEPALLDNFNRANENPVSQGGNWASIGINGGKGARLSGNRLATFGQPGTSYRVAPYPADMDASATVVAAPSTNDWLSVYVGLQDVGTTGWDGYELRATTVGGPDLWQIRKVLNGAPTILAATNFEITVGSMLLRRLGTGLEFWWKPSGGSWGRQLATADTTYGTGKIGVGGQKSGALDDFGGGDATNVSLLQRYAPELRYHEAETYRADSAAIMTDNYVSGQYSNQLKDGSDALIAVADPADPVDDLTFGYLGALYPGGRIASTEDYIDAANSSYAEDAQRLHADPLYANVVYGRVIPLGDGGSILQYWLFYYDNPKTYLGFGAHEGDWEWVQVRTDSTGTGMEAAYSQHGDGERCNWTNVPRTPSGRPIVFVAEGSHANFFTTGWHVLTDDFTSDQGEHVTPAVHNISLGPTWTLWPGKWGGSASTPRFGQWQVPNTRWVNPLGWSNSYGCSTPLFGAPPSPLSGTVGGLEPAAPDPPAIEAGRVGTSVTLLYSLAQAESQGQEVWQIITTIQPTDRLYVPLTIRAHVNSRRGVVRRPIGLGDGPYEVSVVAVARNGARSGASKLILR